MNYCGQRFDFSSVSRRQKGSNSELLQIIESEIKCAEECEGHDRVEEIPEGFPFEIQDEEGKNIILLKRTYQDENIEVRVSMPSLVTGEELEDDAGGNDDDEDGGNDERPSQSNIPLTVSVNKGQGPSLEFHCTAYPDELVIDAMSVRETPSDEEMLSYEGPDFSDLDENLQKAFHKYLEIRGISAITTNFLHEYMINKDSHEYLLWLKNLKDFVEK